MSVDFMVPNSQNLLDLRLVRCFDGVSLDTPLFSLAVTEKPRLKLVHLFDR